MKRYILKYFLPLFLLVTACSDDKVNEVLIPYLEMTDNEIVILDKEYTQANTFITSNVSWQIDVADIPSWMSIEPKSGGAGTTTVNITLENNNELMDRNALLTVIAGTERRTLLITQKKRDAVTKSKDKFEFDEAGGQFEVEIQANIDYQIVIPSRYASWLENISDVDGLHTFRVSTNNTPIDREGVVVIEEISGKYADTVWVLQGQKDSLIFGKRVYEVPLSGVKGMRVNLRSNVNYEISVPPGDESWIDINPQSRAWRTDILMMDIDTSSVGERETTITVTDRANPARTDQIRIRQVDMDFIYLSNNESEIGMDGGEVQFVVQANVPYSVDIPERFRSWVRIVSHVVDTVTVAVTPRYENEHYARVGYVTVKADDPNSSAYYYFKITQEASAEEYVSQAQALQRIYEEMEGPTWGASFRRGWENPILDGGEAMLPYGVSVDENFNVTELKFTSSVAGSTIKGKIPSIISKLSKLKVLWIGTATPTSSSAYTNILGIPEEIGLLTELEDLRIAVNDTVTFPSTIGNLKNVKYLSLVGGKRAPESVSEMEGLEQLILYNKTTYAPENIGNLKNLRILRLGTTASLPYKGTTLPSSIGMLKNLELLFIRGNGNHRDSSALSAGLPDEFAGMEKLRMFNVSYVNMNTLPASFGNLPKLDSMSINYSTFSSIPEGFGNLPELRTLVITNCSSFANLSSSFSSLRNLTTLTISNSTTLTTLPANFADLPNLSTLTLSNNSRFTSLPSNFADLPNLRTLTISSNSALTSLPVNFGNLPKLETLTISSNSALTSLPVNFGNLSNLKTLSITSNTRLASLPESFGQLGNLEVATMNSNVITSLPENLSGLTSLREWRLNNNRIDSIPASIGQLTNLQLLHLHQQRSGTSSNYTYYLNTTLPPELGNLANLTNLQIHDNRDLKGEIPAGIVNNSRLEFLYLYNNALTGPIPTGLANIQTLRYLRLENNQLTGTVPDFRMHERGFGLFYCYLYMNRLTGNIHDSMLEYIRNQSRLTEYYRLKLTSDETNSFDNY